VGRTHPVVVDGGERRPSPTYAAGVAEAARGEPLPPPTGPVAQMGFDIRGLGQLRRFAADAATRAGLDADRVDDLLLVVNELAANTVQYAGGTGVLKSWRTERDLVCEVHDSGQITDPLAGTLTPAPESPHGRGLVIVNHLCDLVRIHTAEDSTTIRVYFRL
jgi:anti-sigma regulatory factor (Ser/Thr protein kinase)